MIMMMMSYVLIQEAAAVHRLVLPTPLDRVTSCFLMVAVIAILFQVTQKV